MALFDIRFGKRGVANEADERAEPEDAEMTYEDDAAAQSGGRSRRGRRLLLVGAALAGLVYWRRRRSHRADAVEVTVDGETVGAR